MKPIDLTGHRYNRWLVLKPAGLRNKKRFWLCRCDCGAEKEVQVSLLRSGHTKSCGCWNRESAVARATTHGGTKTPLFSVWKGMRSRCCNPNSKSFKDYGDRGIRICDQWQDFANFRRDMGDTYKPGLTIERIDVDKGYGPGNCKWIPKSEQSKNRRSVIWVKTPKGLMSVTDAAKIAGVSWFAMKARVDRNWPIDRLFLPPRDAR